MYDQLLKLVAARPMLPFRVHLNSGEQIDVVVPNSAAPAKAELLVKDGQRVRWIPFPEISRVEMLPNGSSAKGSR